MSVWSRLVHWHHRAAGGTRPDPRTGNLALGLLPHNWTVALCGVAVIVALVFWGAGRMLYYPSKYPQGDWSVQRALAAEDVSLRASDGTRLHAWWIAATAPSPAGHPLATLHLHGNAGNISNRDLTAKHITAAGSSVLLLDYRGYGKSAGRPSEAGLYRDSEAAWNWIVARGFTPGQIVIHGESLGTAVAVHLAAEKPAAGVVLEAPFTSVRAVAGRIVPGIGPLLVRGYDSKALIPRVRVPVFFIHGDRDEVIAYQFGQELFRAANNPKRFWTIHGATHNDLHVVAGVEFPP